MVYLSPSFFQIIEGTSISSSSLNSMSLFEGFFKHFGRQTTFATFEAEKNKFD